MLHTVKTVVKELLNKCND